MAREQKDNTGVLFQNHKRKTEKHPTLTGQCRIDGVDYWISGWTKQGDTEKFWPLAFKPKEKKSVQQKLDDQETQGDTPY